MPDRVEVLGRVKASFAHAHRFAALTRPARFAPLAFIGTPPGPTVLATFRATKNLDLSFIRSQVHTPE